MTLSILALVLISPISLRLSREESLVMSLHTLLHNASMLQHQLIPASE